MKGSWGLVFAFPGIPRIPAPAAESSRSDGRNADGLKEYDYTIIRSQNICQVNKYLFFRPIKVFIAGGTRYYSLDAGPA
jgi:hypothetical protein